VTSLRLRLSVIVPIYQAAETLEACLVALAVGAADVDEIIVADDGSTDAAVASLPDFLCQRVRVVRSEKNIGRGPVRNLGAQAATGDVLVFVDADVAVHTNTLGAICAAFDDDPGRVSLIGAYDDRPTAKSWVSQYRNLLHHYVHHTHGSRATHFWTGLGAVRRDVFVALGGLDEGNWARNMEDVEFGHRLVDAGHTVDVLPHIQGTHMKRFTFTSMVKTDLLDRAIPWSTLMLRDHLRSDRFVTSSEQVTSAACSWIIAAATAAAIVLNFADAPLALLAAGLAGGAAVVFLAVNVSLWRFLARTRSGAFAAFCVPLHLLHAGVSALGFGLALGAQLGRREDKSSLAVGRLPVR